MDKQIEYKDLKAKHCIGNQAMQGILLGTSTKGNADIRETSGLTDPHLSCGSDWMLLAYYIGRTTGTTST